MINFYKSFDYKMALETIEQIDDEEIVHNPKLLKLKGEILKLNCKYKESLQFYEKYISLYCSNK